MEQLPEDVALLLDNVFLNMVTNLTNNLCSLDTLDDVENYCSNYLTDFSSVISANIRDVTHKEILHEALEFELMEAVWMTTALQHYKNELENHLELENMKQLEHSEPNEKKYTLKKQETKTD